MQRTTWAHSLTSRILTMRVGKRPGMCQAWEGPFSLQRPLSSRCCRNHPHVRGKHQLSLVKARRPKNQISRKGLGEGLPSCNEGEGRCGVSLEQPRLVSCSLSRALAKALHLFPPSQEVSGLGHSVSVPSDSLSGKGHSEGVAGGHRLLLLGWPRHHLSPEPSTGWLCGLDQLVQPLLEPQMSWGHAGGGGSLSLGPLPAWSKQALRYHCPACPQDTRAAVNLEEP